MSLAEILGYVVERLDRAGIPHMISGSVASAHHGEPRSTQDVDLVIDPTVIALTTFVGSLDRERYYIDDALEALERRSRCNVIDVTTGWKVDLIVVKDRPFSRVELARRQPLTLLGIGTFVATVEDVILSKLEWSRAATKILCIMIASSSPILSTKPLQTGFSSGILNNWYFMELLPVLIIKMFIVVEWVINYL